MSGRAAGGSVVVMSHTTVSPIPVSFDDAGHGEPALGYLTGWCSTCTATYFPMLEQPAELATDVTAFTGALRIPGRLASR
jgi:hypothetical protein